MNNKSFAETAMELSGKSKEEAQSIGKIDTADDQVEDLFDERHRTVHSPVYRAVWDRHFPIKDFTSKFNFSRKHRDITDRCLEVLRTHKDKGSLYDIESGKLSNSLLNDLKKAGYFGLLVPLPNKELISFSEFADFLSEVASIDPHVAGLASVHGCIGAVDPIKTFGTQEQKDKYLPPLASGELLSAFALTEPCAGSDMTALRTTARLDGDHYVVNGEKLFITNALEGRLISLVCLIDDQPQVLIAQLPTSQDNNFQIKKYGLHALKRLHNNGLIFKNFKVHKENLIQLPHGNGLTIAYHGLNLGRVALCANASGCMNAMLWSMIPWAKFRTTYGQEIGNRELVQDRVARLSGYILSTNALTSWCSSLLDLGYRGELECIIAKTFGSECEKESAIELCMKTHGGRSFLHGHLIGDNIHEFLAPLIYEGEGDMLNMAFFKTLVKDHGVKYFEPIGKFLAKKQRKKPIATDFFLRPHLFVPYATWVTKNTILPDPRVDISHLPSNLAAHAEFAIKHLQKSRVQISQLMRRYQLKLADRQCRMSILSRNLQHLITILVTVGYTSSNYDNVTAEIADVACENLKNKVLGCHPSDAQIRKSVKLGEKLSNQQWGDRTDIRTILMRY